MNKNVVALKKVMKMAKAMPTKKMAYGKMAKAKPKTRRPSRGMKGSGLGDWIRKVGSFLKQHKLISKGANLLGSVLPGGYGSVARGVGTAAGSLGYGRRRRGGALRLAGAGLMLA